MRNNYLARVIWIGILGWFGSSGLHAQEYNAPGLPSGNDDAAEIVLPEGRIGQNDLRNIFEELKDAIAQLNVQALSVREEMTRDNEPLRLAHEALVAAIGELRSDLSSKVELTDTALVAGLSELRGDLASDLESSNAEIHTLKATTREELERNTAMAEAMQGEPCR